MSRPKLFSAILFASFVGCAAPAFAQPDDTRTTQSDRGDDNDNSGMLGLLGLLGSLGLLGLKRRRNDEHEVRRTHVPVGAH